jgi:hypothetical protein
MPNAPEMCNCDVLGKQASAAISEDALSGGESHKWTGCNGGKE